MRNITLPTSVLTRFIARCDHPSVFKAVMLAAVMMLLLLVSLHAMAVTAGGDPSTDTTWGSLYKIINDLFTGDAAIIVSLLALATGVLGAIATSHKATSIIMGIGIPIAINVGPSIFKGLSGAVC